MKLREKSDWSGISLHRRGGKGITFNYQFSGQKGGSRERRVIYALNCFSRAQSYWVDAWGDRETA